jgi:hypothetical protein
VVVCVERRNEIMTRKEVRYELRNDASARNDTKLSNRKHAENSRVLRQFRLSTLPRQSATPKCMSATPLSYPRVRSVQRFGVRVEYGNFVRFRATISKEDTKDSEFATLECRI